MRSITWRSPPTNGLTIPNGRSQDDRCLTLQEGAGLSESREPLVALVPDSSRRTLLPEGVTRLMHNFGYGFEAVHEVVDGNPKRLV